MPVLEILSWVIGVLVVVAVLPGTSEILFLTIGALRQPRPAGSGRVRSCRLAVVIPAHDEEILIRRTVASVTAAAQAGCRDIVVVADNCTDATARLAGEAGARVLLRRNDEERGKGYALRFAFDRLVAEGFDAFLVIDADSIVSSNLVQAVLERLEQGASAVQCRYRILNRGTLRTQLMDTALLAFNVLRPRGRSGWGASAGILGNGFAIHRELLEKVAYTAGSVVEDLEYHLMLVAASERVEFLDHATVYGETPEGGKAVRVQRSRWEGGRLRMTRDWAGRLVSNVASGQWRLIEPLLDLLTLPLAYHVLLLLLLLTLPWPFRLFGIAALLIVAGHLLRAAFLGERPWKTILSLAAAPFYIVWKVTTLGAVWMASRKHAAWERTDRDPAPGLGLAD